MVLVDGRDANWLGRFHAASADLGTGRSDDVGGRRSRNIQRPRDEEQVPRMEEVAARERNFCFVHLNLSEVPLERLELEEHAFSRHRDHCHRPPKDDDDDNDDEGEEDASTADGSHERHLAVDVVDCTGLESGLRRVLSLPLERLYVSTETTLRQDAGRMFSAGLRRSSGCLRRLQLSSATWTPAAMRGLSRGLEAADALQELNLSYTHWKERPQRQEQRGTDNGNDDAGGGDGGQRGAGARTINVVDADMCVRLLAGGLAKSHVVCLKLNRCYLADPQIAVLVRRGLIGHRHLRELYLGGNYVGDEALTALAEYLNSQSGRSLVTLGLSNPLAEGPAEDVHPFDVLDGREATPPQVTHYTHSRNSHVAILYPSLAVNTALRVLHLASNRLHDDDMLPLCRAISQSCVTMLDLKSNRVTDRGIQILSSCLPSQLERLWLLGNPMGVRGGQCLYDALKRRLVNLVDLRFPTYKHHVLLPELAALDVACRNYLILNRGGRRILAEEDADGEPDSEIGRQRNEYSRSQRTATPEEAALHRRPKVPRSLWPLVLERVNRTRLVIPWTLYSHAPNPSEEANRANVMFYLLRNGSVLRQRG